MIVLPADPRIWKFPLPLEDLVEVSMPKDSRILSLACQDGQICMWAKCDPDAPKVTRKFVIAGTGHPLPFGLGEFIGTVLMGPLVWHVFEFNQ